MNIYFNKLFYIKRITISQKKIIVIILLYILSITTPSVFSTKNINFFASKMQQYKFLFMQNNHTALQTKENKIDVVTYIANEYLIARQINNILQKYINGYDKSIFKIINFTDWKNNQTYHYDAYGLAINLEKSKSIIVPQNRKIYSVYTNTYTCKKHIKENLFLELPANGEYNQIPNAFEYQGQRLDSNTNLQYLQSRFYNSLIKRFLTEDSCDLLNKFNYASNNPISNQDLSGHTPNKKYWQSNRWRRFFSTHVNAEYNASDIEMAYTAGVRDFTKVKRIKFGTFNLPNLNNAKFDTVIFNTVTFNNTSIAHVKANNAIFGCTLGNLNGFEKFIKKNKLKIQVFSNQGGDYVFFMTKHDTRFKVFTGHGMYHIQNGFLMVPEHSFIIAPKLNTAVNIFTYMMHSTGIIYNHPELLSILANDIYAFYQNYYFAFTSSYLSNQLNSYSCYCPYSVIPNYTLYPKDIQFWDTDLNHSICVNRPTTLYELLCMYGPGIYLWGGCTVID